MNEGKTVDVDVFTRDTLPQRLVVIAEEQGVILGTELIFVMTKCCPPSYVFEPVGSKPEELLACLHRISAEDGVDLNEVVKRVFQSSEQTPKEAGG